MPAASSLRTSASRVAAIRGELVNTDWELIRFLSELRLATGHQLARRFWAATVPTDPRARRARRTLARLEGWRVIHRLGRRLGGVRGGSTSIVYGLGPVGRRLLASNGFAARRVESPGASYIAHAVAVTELVVQLAEAERAGALEVIALESEPQCWRGFLGPYGERRIVKPDLAVRVGAGRLNEDRWWIECDLGTESAAAIARKAKRYIAYWRTGSERVFPRIAFTVPDQPRAEQITGALERLPAEAQPLFVVWLYDGTIGRLAAEART